MSRVLEVIAGLIMMFVMPTLILWVMVYHGPQPGQAYFILWYLATMALMFFTPLLGGLLVFGPEEEDFDVEDLALVPGSLPWEIR